MRWRYLDSDPLTGARNYHGYDHENKRTIIKTEFDKDHIRAVRDRNTDLQNEFKYKFVGADDGTGMRHVASVDCMTMLQWREEGVDIFNPDHWEEVKKRLNDPNWRKLRTSSERI